MERAAGGAEPWGRALGNGVQCTNTCCIIVSNPGILLGFSDYVIFEAYKSVHVYGWYGKIIAHDQLVIINVPQSYSTSDVPIHHKLIINQ